MSFEQLTLNAARRDLATLSSAVLGWLDERIDATTDRGRSFASNHSQLVSLRHWFYELLKALGQRLEGSPELDLVRQLRRSMFGLFGLWDTLRQRLQQRESPDAQVFAGADDVAFCCYEPTVIGARLELAAHPNRSPPERPPPMPFLCHDADPRMFPSGPIPEVFARAIGAQALGRLQNTWPLAMVHLPISCTWAPWWLVVLGHEVGHQIQFELALKAPFAQALYKAAEMTGRPPNECAVWSGWGVEIFADTYSVLMMGRAAIRALFELVYDRPAAMQQRYPTYPPAVIRLELMNRLADAIQLPTNLALPKALQPIIDSHEPTRTDAKTLDAIVPVLTGPLPDIPGSPTLAELCGHGLSDKWSEVRMVVQESFAEYTRRPLDESDATKLANRTIERIRANAPAGLRGPQEFLALTEQRAAELADSLLVVEGDPS